jgi:DNA relaxase NicK
MSANMQSETAPTPHIVTTGGKVSPLPPEDPSLTTILDFLTVSMAGTVGELKSLVKVLFRGVRLEPSSRGWCGYEERENLLLKTSDGAEMLLGFIAYGGEHQRGRRCVSLSGVGCAAVKSWEPMKHALTRNKGKITRIDLAVDDIGGGRLSLSGARKAHKRGGFTSAGRKPGSCWYGNDSNAGNTFNVGSRQGGKMFRAYEKGKQLGDRESKWVRFEVELHCKDRVIPLDVLNNPLQYFRGAYPYLGRVVPHDTPVLSIPTVKATAQISAMRALEIARHQCGGFIDRMLRAGADGDTLCRTMARKSPCKRLQVWTLPEAVQNLGLAVKGHKVTRSLPLRRRAAWEGPQAPAWRAIAEQPAESTIGVAPAAAPRVRFAIAQPPNWVAVSRP